IDASLKLFRQLKMKKPRTFLDYRELLADPELDAVIVSSSWNSHIPIAIAAMRAGKPVGFEVGGATSIQQLWELVHTSESTGVPCMLLENCCYGRDELMVLDLVRQGLFGELIYCEGGYEHNLSGMACSLERNRERAFHNLRRNGDLYPTHALGPIAKILGINRGNRFVSLTSTATKARGFAAAAAAREGQGAAGHTVFNKGDVVTTVIKCANGEVVTLKHCVSLPRPYSRDCRVQGTRGIWLEDAKGLFIEGLTKTEFVDDQGKPYHAEKWDPIDTYHERYDHPIWKRFRANIKGGHGGMDTLVLQGFFDAVRKRVQTPIDVYDTAAWMAITCLSEDSIAMGSQPVPVPDFTNGRWINREPEPESPWSLTLKPDASPPPPAAGAGRSARRPRRRA
ncbi:MAG: Gfo/Idh/MocA family oxidoreductase, partial [Lentisphaerae bacterium]|nr:Gfo/Idh/MocA family oxidoreductase [Lentisphaerota bacterium]